MLTVSNPLVIVFEDEEKDELICHLHPQKEKGHDYRTYGVVVADIVRHVANCFGVPESYVWNWVDKERRNPTAKAIRTGGKGL